MINEYPVDSDRVAARRPIHPGIIFGEEVMPELRRQRSVGEIAALLGVSRQTLHRVTVGGVGISADMAARIGKLVGNGARIWLAMQADYDAWEAVHRLDKELKKIPTLA
jgi:addiction module HigA family antidote